MHKFKLLLLCIIIFVFSWLFSIYSMEPTNNRDWLEGMEILPRFEIIGDQVSIHNFRDFEFSQQGLVSKNYQDREVNVNNITKVWFVQEPFVIKPFTDFKGVAHTYFVFDFSDQEPIVVSVEARREKGQKFDAWVGMANQFELIYLWGSERDETVRRIISENNKLYMYPLKISQNGAQQLFLQLAQTSHELEAHPRFYNTLTSNCTNELAKVANKVKPGAIPFNRALFFPGYSDIELYNLGYIPTDMPLEKLKEKYEISEEVRQFYQQKDFSSKLRMSLN